MKICAACGQDLPKARFSKKQWQLKQHQRRCKDCIATDRHVPPQTLNNNDVNEDAMPDDLTFIMQKMSQMRGQIISSLGEGYDTKSLKLLDEKLCNYFLDEDSLYFDDDKRKKKPNPEKPRSDEVEHYKKSDIIRKGVLSEASSFEAMANFLGGHHGHKNLKIYQEFYEDVLSYHYAWFELIFKESRTDLHAACSTLVKFVSVKLECERVDVEEVHKINELLREVVDIFLLSVQEYDAEGCEDSGHLESDCYEINYKMSIEMAKKNREEEAEDYFSQALMAENTWGYMDEEGEPVRYCAEVLEFAIGRSLLDIDLCEIDDMFDDSFYPKCLQAFLHKRRGGVQWNHLGRSSSQDSGDINDCNVNTDLHDDSFLRNEGNFNSHNELNESLRNQWEEEWKAILDDPDSTKSMRDIAISQLNDNVGIGDVFTGKSKIEMKIGDEVQVEVAAKGNWILVEDFEEGNWSPSSGNVVVSTAAEEILSREIEDGRGPLGLSSRGLQQDGSFDFFAAYPKLIEACTTIIDGAYVDNELKSNAYTVVSHLRAQQSFNDISGEAMADLKKAVKLNPSDWRLHSALATRNMAVYNTALALESITRALELTTDNFASFSLGIHKGKILFNLGDNYQWAIEAFEEAITLFDNGLKDHRQMSDKLIGRLAVAEYMLVILYGKQGEHKKAANHYRDAEKKRDSIDEDVSKTIDWTNRVLAEVVIANIRPGNLAQGECHHCGEITDNPLRCSACKAVFYCGRDCQLSAWKGGHKKECKQLKSERRKKESTANQEFNIEQSRVNLLPLDANLDPNGLWKDGVQLSNKGEFEEAAWKFLLALFMNAALDANDRVRFSLRGG